MDDREANALIRIVKNRFPYYDPCEIDGGKSMVDNTWLKVFDSSGALRAIVRDTEEAAILVAHFGNDASIRCRDDIVWVEGREWQSAAESYDFVADTILDRI